MTQSRGSRLPCRTGSGKAARAREELGESLLEGHLARGESLEQPRERGGSIPVGGVEHDDGREARRERELLPVGYPVSIGVADLKRSRSGAARHIRERRPADVDRLRPREDDEPREWNEPQQSTSRTVRTRREHRWLVT